MSLCPRSALCQPPAVMLYPKAHKMRVDTAVLLWTAPLAVLTTAAAAILAFHVWQVGPATRPTTPPEVREALDVLGGHQATAQLRDMLDHNQVSYQFVSMSPGMFARYTVNRKTIDIDLRLRDEDKLTLAALLAHEAVHAQDAVDGYLSTGGADACIGSELRAFRTSGLFWTEVYGPAGKVDANDELEQQLNLIADRALHDPSALEQMVRLAYVNQCG